MSTRPFTTRSQSTIANQLVGQRFRVGRVYAHNVVTVNIEEATLTVYDGQAVIAVVPRVSITDVNQFRAKHQIRASG